jgi:choline dehydrogenase-like flavoprotein
MGDIKNTVKQRTYDAIVIGSGMSGGWAAKEFTEKGLKTLVLERGRDVKHIKDYPTANMYPYEFEHLGEMPFAEKKNKSYNKSLLRLWGRYRPFLCKGYRASLYTREAF